MCGLLRLVGLLEVRADPPSNRLQVRLMCVVVSGGLHHLVEACVDHTPTRLYKYVWSLSTYNPFI